MRRIYLTGASSEAGACAVAMQRLRDAGHVVTFDWTLSVLANQAAGRTDVDLPDHDRRRFAREDLEGILDADTVWLRAPASGTSRGCWVELGAALVSQAVLIVSGDDRASIFTSLANMTFATHDDALRRLTR